MFDSENHSLITRIEAGPGVVIDYTTNSEGDNVWTASVDSDWLTTSIQERVAGSIPLSVADEARLVAVEAAVGITYSAAPVVTPTPPAGEMGTSLVSCTITSLVLANDTTVGFKVYDANGGLVVDESVTVSANSSSYGILQLLAANMKNNATISKIFVPSMGNTDMIITWEDSQADSTIAFTVTSDNTADSVAFTVTNYR